MIDLHIHSIFSDGEFIPSEIVSRGRKMGYRALALTDHVDTSNLEFVVTSIMRVSRDLTEETDVKVLPGVEITHVPPSLIPGMIEVARELGVKIVVVHGETIVEPVPPGTNRSAILGGADILAHPGLISADDADLAAKRGVFLELTARGGHSLTNGHVARLAKERGARLVFNTDSHSPRDFVDLVGARKILAGAGLTLDDITGVFENSETLVEGGE